MSITADSSPDIPAAKEQAVVQKAMGKLIPFLFFLYIIAYLDRVNVGFAKLQMNELDWLKGKEEIYGLAAGIFFIGYFLFEVPSNLILQKVGARPWIARIMVTWGLIAMGMAFVSSPMSFYTMRFLLGIAEAGFFPGVLLYLTYWFTAKERARAVAFFMTANAVTFSFGGPLSGWLMSLPTIGGLKGYQMMYLIEGLPAILMAFVVLKYLPNGPDEAKWLTEEEKQILKNRLARESPTKGDHHSSLGDAIREPKVWLFCAIYFCLVTGMYGLSLWIPQTVKDMGQFTEFQVGMLCAIPYIAAGILMVINATHSDRTGERRFHVMLPATLGAIGLAGYAMNAQTPMVALTCLTIAAAGMWSTLGPFWSLPPITLGVGTALAAGLALINSVGNLGGFLGPYVVGYIKEITKQNTTSFYFLAASVLLGGLLALLAPRPATPRPGEDR